MKALLLTGPRQMNWETLPDPTPAPHEAVVQVSYAGVCGTDVNLFVNEHMIQYRNGFARLPLIPGHEWTGVVAATGCNVNHVKPGERVIAEVAIGCGQCRYCRIGRANVCRVRREVGIFNQNGGFAQLACVPAVALRPVRELSAESAVFAEPVAVALNACRRVSVSPGDRVLVVGAGPIGLLVAQCARACGADFIAVLDRDTERLDLARQFGADAVLNTNDFELRKLPEVALQVTSGEGFDVALECAGAVPVFEHLTHALARLGRIAMVGCFGCQRPALDVDTLIQGEHLIAGAVGGGSSYSDAIELLLSGAVRPELLISHTLPMAEGSQLLAALSERRGPNGALKIVLKP